MGWVSVSHFFCKFFLKSNTFQNHSQKINFFTTITQPTMTLSQLASNSSHRRQICLLYKKSLRLAQDWYLSRPEFREKAVQIRIMFEQNRNVTNPKQVQELVKQTEWLLAEYHHPNPYICTYFVNFY